MAEAVQPFIVGSGNAGKAMAKALAMLNLIQSDVKALEPVFVKRGQELDELGGGTCPRLLVVANPHGLHARTLLEGEAAGFRTMVAEKPACVLLEEIALLRKLTGNVSVCHGYRQMWGPQALRQLISSGELGEIISVEGRYWQSSAAQRALSGPKPGGSWKNDAALSGPHDVLVDLGAHWVDLVLFLLGERPKSGEAWLHFANAEAPHRDTHVHLQLAFEAGHRAVASISKTLHGAGNDLEIHVIGSRQAASWAFASPDALQIGRGGERRTLPRTDAKLGSRQAPFHGTGWLEGYLEILHQSLRAAAGLSSQPVPTLGEHLDAMEVLLTLPRA